MFLQRDTDAYRKKSAAAREEKAVAFETYDVICWDTHRQAKLV